MERDSKYLRDPSAYSTPSAREDFPEPETPAITTISCSGISISMFFRLWTFAPRTSMCLGGIFPCLTSLDMTMASSPFRVSSVPDGCFCSAWPHHSVFRPYIKCAFSQRSNMHDSVSESAGKVMGFRPRSAIVDWWHNALGLQMRRGGGDGFFR